MSSSDRGMDLACRCSPVKVQVAEALLQANGLLGRSGGNCLVDDEIDRLSSSHDEVAQLMPQGSDKSRF